MSNIGWRFPPLSGGTQQGYTNNDIEVFKGNELIDNLAREICQNSLDAHKENTTDPVKVVFELKRIIKDYDVFAQYGDCLKGCRKYWGLEMDSKLSQFVNNAENALKEKEIPVLIASDYNTNGLTGSSSKKLSSPWRALTGSDGVSVKLDEDSAGSYGIGKNAPFACSSLSMVFYNTLDIEKESAFIGVARLATLLNSDGRPTQRVGKFQNNDDENEEWYPIFPEDKCKFRDCFKREEQGTDVIIVGFTQEINWINNITNAVLRNFFVAISEERLIVELKDDSEHCIIDSSTISKLFSESSFNKAEMIAASELYKAFTEPDSKKLLSILKKDDVEVYIKSDSSYKRTIANFRSTGMLVGTYYRRIFQHYAAVVVVRGKELGELLKDTEPPRHNRWDWKQINSADKARQNKARDAINKIDESVLALLKEQFEVVTEETVDAAGVGEYLPDDFDKLGGKSEGEDILKAKVKIGLIKTKKFKHGTKTQVGVQNEGSAQEGFIHNEEKNPNPLPPRPHPPKPVIDNPEEMSPQLGASPGEGTKTVQTPYLSEQRAYPVNSAEGLYKIIINPAEDYKNLYVECFAVGEDGKADALELESFTYSGSSVKFKKGKAGPISVKADIPAIFYARFARKEKMKLSLHIAEVINK